ncbi:MULTISPECIES: alpha/beta fold hydrolase [unclassified Arthrobacter]|uniref:alpha/beta fold hydrolase n=1 Tax=unclassified Arthrobacter TaxID=235627 RepID=UPI001492C1FD|nr:MULTISPECIES: alpha/beta fold hydrolase [unclassified Arthrobacter]MBE0010280.1 alpha/beta fold hydrolase [Arthrobacter sp. AET 35A]NOJ64157.1 alpha/beta fold hydrolase [Arthrobacter sp. 147(2020)]
MHDRALQQLAAAPDGTHLSWREAGSGEPLLLISGQAVDSSSWDALLPSLGRHFRVITFDHRGTGQSSIGPDEAYSTAGFARDAVAVLDAAGVERAHVYGHSMGGRVAQWMAIDHPDRLGSLILGATTAGDRRGVPRSQQATADLASGDPDLIAKLFFRSGTRREDAEAFFNQSASRHARRLHLAASRNHDAWDSLHLIAAPTLVIHGTDDEMTPPGNAERIAAAIPNAELILLQAARHGYYLEESEATAHVIGFLQRNPLQ